MRQCDRWEQALSAHRLDRGLRPALRPAPQEGSARQARSPATYLCPSLGAGQSLSVIFDLPHGVLGSEEMRRRDALLLAGFFRMPPDTQQKSLRLTLGAHGRTDSPTEPSWHSQSPVSSRVTRQRPADPPAWPWGCRGSSQFLFPSVKDRNR